MRRQAMTVSGLTRASADRQSDYAPGNQAQNKRSAIGNFGRLLSRASEHADLVPQRQDLYLKSGTRTED